MQPIITEYLTNYTAPVARSVPKNKKGRIVIDSPDRWYGINIATKHQP